MEFFLMFEFARNIYIRRNRKKSGIDSWKKEIINTILTKVIPDGEPYYYDTVLSFLQPNRYNLDTPIRVDLFLPNFPLIIDIIGIDGSPDFTIAKRYITRENWDTLQSGISWKSSRLLLYKCPYFILRDNYPSDISSIKIAIGNLTNKRLKN